MPINMAKANTVFTPGAPIQSNELFSGRQEQIRRIVEAIPSPGVNPVIFGQRGVGKTSLANIIRDLLPESSTIKVTCDSSDTLHSIWDKVLRQASVSFKKRALGFLGEDVEKTVSLDKMLPKGRTAKPSDIHAVLEGIKAPSVFVLDEFDRLKNQEATSGTADLIKSVSDNLPLVTIVVVGVGGSVIDLIRHHESIGRNLRQIEMPKMTVDEITAILKRGFNALGIQCSNQWLQHLAVLTDGFPHYAHLLGLAVARTLSSDEQTEVTEPVYERACAAAVDDAIETLRDAYSLAAATYQPSKYPMILAACGFAAHDERGVFRAKDVVNAANELFAEDYSVPGVVPALAAFASPDRGPVLETIKVSGRNQYRFANPMMRPFLRIKARTIVSENA